MFGEFPAISNEFQKGSGILGKFAEFWRKKLEVSTLSLCSELWHLWLNSVFGVTLMGVIFMGSTVTFMGNCDIYGKRYDIYGNYDIYGRCDIYGAYN